MKFKLLISSLTNYRNIGILAILTILAIIMENTLQLPWNMAFVGFLVAFAAYVGFSMQSFTSKEFQDKFLQSAKKKNLKHLDEQSTKLADDAMKHTNAAYYKKLCSIMDDKNEIMNSYSKDDSNYLKEKMAEHTLNLVITYIKLLKNFCIRSREISLTDVSPVMERINQNSRKLNFIKDAKVYEDLKKTIEMDEKIIKRLKEEKQELERMDTKLDYIKSTVSMFKHQIGLSMESEEVLEKIENVVNEAVALENVLNERHKSRNQKIR